MSLVHSMKKSIGDVFGVISSTTNVVGNTFDALSVYSRALNVNANNYVLIAETLAPKRAKIAIEEEINELADQLTNSKIEIAEKCKNQNYANIYAEALRFLND